MGFWPTINIIIYTLLSIAFGYRVAAVTCTNEHRAEAFRLLSFREFYDSLSNLSFSNTFTDHSLTHSSNFRILIYCCSFSLDEIVDCL